MNDFDRELMRNLNKQEEESPEKETIQRKEGKHKEAKDWIQDYIEKSPHDFIGFEIGELTPSDFELVDRFLLGKVTDNELRARQANLDINNPLNKSQKSLNAYLINRIMEQLTHHNQE